MRRILIFSGLIMFFVISNVYADKGTTSIVDLEGIVLVKKANDKDYSDAEVDMEIEEGDEIVTKEDGKAELVFDDDDTIVKLSENTQLVIRKINKVANKRESLLELLKGEIINLINKVTGVKNHFEIKTPSAVAAVKGTEFAVNAGDKGSYIGVFDGEVNVSGIDPTGNKIGDVAVTRDKEIRVLRYQKPIGIQILSWRMKALQERLPQIRIKLATYQKLKKTGMWTKIQEARMAAKVRDLIEWVKNNRGWFDKLPAEKKEKIHKFIEVNKHLKDLNTDKLRKEYPLMIDKFREIQRQNLERLKSHQSMPHRQPDRKPLAPVKK